MNPTMSPWMHVAGWTLVHFVWQGAVIALAAAVLLRLLRTASSQARYGVACAALVAMLVASAVTARLVSIPATVERDAAVWPREFSVSRPAEGPPSIIWSPRAATAGSNFSLDEAWRTVDQWLPIVVTAWFVGVALLLVRLAGGWWCVRRLHRMALAQVAPEWQTMIDGLASRLGLTHAVHVVESIAIDTPTVLGWLRPVVLLPVAALASLTPAQVEAILAHELAHVRRHDYLVNLLQTVVETLLFYHPAVWWVSSRIRAEREHCCDEIAVAICGDAVGYAAALAELETARTGSAAPAGQAALVLAATGGSLLDRVRRVLRVPVHDERRVASETAPALMTAALVVLVVVGIGGLRRPALQASSETRPTLAIASSFDAPLEPHLFFKHRGIGEVRQRVVIQVRQSATPASSSTIVTGSIADPTGKGIPEATVVLTDVGSAPDRSVRTDESGRFELVGLPFGQYMVRVTAPGLEPFNDRLAVFPGAKIQLDVRLQVQSLSIGFSVGRPAPPPGAAGPRPLPAGWICLDDAGPLVRPVAFPPPGFCGPPSLVQEFARDRDAALATFRKQGAQPSALLARAPLDYPQELWDALIEGSVVIEGRIGTDGSAVDLKSVAPVHPGLAKAALDAVRQWRFQPARLHEVAVESPLRVTINFRLH